MLQAETIRKVMVEAAADYDDELMHKYLEEQEITPQEILRALRKACLACEVVPVLCGSSF